MDERASIVDLVSGTIQHFANEWRSWGLLALVVAALLMFVTFVLVGVGVVGGLALGIADAAGASPPPELLLPLAAGLLAGVLMFTACWQLVFAGLLRLAWSERRDGVVPSLEGLWRGTFTGVLPVLAVVIFTGLAGLAGFMLCVLPGLLAGALFVWALPLVVLDGRDPLDAMAESVRQFFRRPWWTIGFTLVGMVVVMILGQILPLLGPGIAQVLYALYLVRGYEAVFGTNG